jgi:tetratricopeptide (TPR) repeat protein
MLRELILRLAGHRPASAVDRLLDAAQAARDRGDLDTASRALLKALELDPGSLPARNELAVVLLALGRPEEALQLLRWVLKRAPDLAAAHANCGIASEKVGRVDEALACFRRAVTLEPDSTTARNNLALCLRRLDRHEEAEVELRRALDLAPGDASTATNLAVLVRELGRPLEACALLEPHLARNPRAVDLRCALAAALQDLGDLDGAYAHYDAALACDSGSGTARLGRGMLRLSCADFARGWDDYEGRYDSDETPRRGFPFPEWDGGAFAGRAVLVYAEQGIGDEIMFANCLPDLIAEAGRVVIECDPRLEPLFVRSFPEAAVFGAARTAEHAWLDRAGAIDVQLAAGSLPRRYRRAAPDFPEHSGYLRADPGRVRHYRERLAALGSGRKVGLAWRGGLMRTRRAIRSIAPELLGPLLARTDLRFVSLQRGDVDEDLARMHSAGGRSPVHWPEVPADPDDAAALMAALDATITVCSSVVHLGGALGVRVLAMVPASPEWRYLRSGDRLPWYPSVEVVRQQRAGDWAAVIECVTRRV